MNFFQPRIHLLSLPPFYVKTASLFSISVGAIVLIGWFVDITLLKSILPNATVVKFNTALSLVLAGISLWLVQEEAAPQIRKRIGYTLASLILIVSLLTLSEYLLQWELGIDQWLVKDLETSSSHPGRMSEITAICFIFISLGLLLIHSRIAEYLSLGVALLAMVVMIGYLFDFKSLYRFEGYGMVPLATAIVLLIFALGILAARPMRGMMRIYTANLPGSRMIRRYLPQMILLIVILGWLVQRAENLGLVDDASDTVILVVLLILVYSPLIYLNAQSINQAEEERQQGEKLLRQIIDLVPHFIFAKDLDGRFILVNQAVANAYGTTVPELTDKTDADFAQSEEEVQQFRSKDMEVIRSGRSLSIPEEQITNASGQIQFLQTVKIPFEFSKSQSGILGISVDITERKRADELLRQSEENFSKAFSSSPTALMITRRADGKYLAINEAYTSIVGYHRTELMGHLSTEFNIFIDPNQRKEIVDQLLENGSLRNYEAQIQNKSGELRTVLASLEQIQFNGEACILSTLVDITERKQAENNLKKNERILRLFVEHSPAAVAMFDKDMKYIIASHRYRVDFELDGQDLTGRSHYDMFPELPERWKQAHQRCLQGVIEKEDEDTFVRADGTLEWERWEIHPWYEAAGKIGGIILFAELITERKRAKEEIQRQLKRLNSLREIDIAISTSFDMRITLEVVLRQVTSQLSVDAAAILLFDPHTQVMEYVCDLGFRTHALRQLQLKVGKGYASRVVLEQQTIHISDGKGIQSESANALQLANEYFVEYYGTPLIVKGVIKGILEIYHRTPFEPTREWLDFMETLAGQAAIAIDNVQLWEQTQRHARELEQRVEERTAELNQTNLELEHANHAKDAFLANMSHELRTPLNSILGLSESLLEQTRDPLSGRQHRSLQTIESSGRHLLSLINDILDLSKIEAGKLDFYPEMIQIAELSQASLAFVKSQALKKSINLSSEEDKTVSKIYADPRRLKQILVNLLTNAVKFTPERGQVTLEVHAKANENLIQFSVTDTGVGIAPADLEKLFQPFVQVDNQLTRQFEGTGLGLALVQKLTDMHGGSVQVDSEVGKGSRFTINLPWARDKVTQLEDLEEIGKLTTPQQLEESIVPSAPTITPRRILLAEDNMANILTIGEYLESHDYQVIVAHDGIEAIEKAQEMDPDIILMDVQMPVMDGLEAIRVLRANPRFASTPIIALTALAMSGDRERCLEAGASEYMNKPVGLKKLLHTIQELLNE